MSKINGIRLRINNQKKYQQRTGGYKKCWWFSFSNTFFDDPEMFELNDSEKIAFVWILCQASQQQKRDVFINVDFAVKRHNIKKEALVSAIRKLHYFKIVTPLDPEYVQELSSTCTESVLEMSSTEEKRTEENRTEENRIEYKGAEENIKGELKTNNRASSIPSLGFIWNENCGQLSKVRLPVSQSRKRKENNLIKNNKDFGPGDWAMIVQRIVSSEFCCGVNDRSWVATFDWLLKNDTVDRVLEGKYDTRINEKKKRQLAKNFNLLEQGNDFTGVLSSSERDIQPRDVTDEKRDLSEDAQRRIEARKAELE